MSSSTLSSRNVHSIRRREKRVFGKEGGVAINWGMRRIGNHRGTHTMENIPMIY